MIKSKIARFLDLNEAGLPKVYSVYRDVLESATKIVKEFEKTRSKSGSRPKSSPSEGRLVVRVTHHFIEEERVMNLSIWVLCLYTYKR